MNVPNPLLENDNELVSQADLLCELVDMPKPRVDYEKVDVRQIRNVMIPIYRRLF
jgi:hypothetical protein